MKKESSKKRLSEKERREEWDKICRLARSIFRKKAKEVLMELTPETALRATLDRKTEKAVMDEVVRRFREEMKKLAGDS